MAISYTPGSALTDIDALKTTMGADYGAWNEAYDVLSKIIGISSAFWGILGNVGELAQGIESVWAMYDKWMGNTIEKTDVAAWVADHTDLLDLIMNVLTDYQQDFAKYHGAVVADNELTRGNFSTTTTYIVTPKENLPDLTDVNTNLISIATPNLTNLITALNNLFKYADTPIAKMLHDNLYVWNSDLGVYQADFRNIAANIGRAADALEQIQANMGENPDYTVILQEISDRILAHPDALVELIGHIFQDAPDPLNANWVLNRICTAITELEIGGGGGGGGMTAAELQVVLEAIFTWVDADDYRWTLPQAIMAVLNGLNIYAVGP